MASWKEKATFFAMQDARACRKEYILPFPRVMMPWVQSRLTDDRDLPVACAVFNILVTVPAAATLLFFSQHSAIRGILYFALVQGIFLQRYLVAVLHTTEHRRLFKPGLVLLNALPRYLLAPFFGLPLGWAYYLHHVMMHHIEDNHAPYDLSSTENFQRDNVVHFLWYWLRHVVAGLAEIPMYAVLRRRFDVALKCIATEILYLLLLRFFWLLNPAATFWVFVLPFFTSSAALMFGNWSQHIFLNRAGRKTAFGLTYNCLNTNDNQRTFNDGYHILHHMNSRTHWSELPLLFIKTLDQHAAAEALVFQGIGVFDVGLAVFTGNLRFLVDHMVLCGPKMTKMSHDELVSLLKDRLKPVV